MASWADGILGALQGAASAYGQNAQAEAKREEETAREERAAKINRERLIEEFNMRRQAEQANRAEDRAWRKEDLEAERGYRKAERDEDRAYNRETMSAQQDFQMRLAKQAQDASARENALSRSTQLQVANIGAATSRANADQRSALEKLQAQLVEQAVNTDPNSEEGQAVQRKIKQLQAAMQAIKGSTAGGQKVVTVNVPNDDPSAAARINNPTVKRSFMLDPATGDLTPVDAGPPSSVPASAQPSKAQEQKKPAGVPEGFTQMRNPVDGTIHWAKPIPGTNPVRYHVWE